MSEATRGWVYRLAVLALIAYVVFARPELKDLIPVLIGLLTSGLATEYTSIVRDAQENGPSSQRRR